MIEPRHPSWWERGGLPPTAPPTGIPDRADVLIVGAGLMGRWLAYWLARRIPSLDILVVERDRFTYGASSRNAGFLTCGQVSEMLADVQSAGLDAVIETFERRRRGIELVHREFPRLATDRSGSVDWDELTEEKRELARELDRVAGGSVYDVRSATLAGRSREVVFNRVDGGLDPVALLRELRKRTDAVFAFGAEATRVRNGTATLKTPGGMRDVEYGRAFLCTNAFTSELDGSSDVQPGRGQIVVTSPVRVRTDRTLGYMNEGYDYFRFIGDRLLLGGGRHMHGDRENGTTTLEPTGEVAAYLAGVAERVIGHADFDIEYHWAGIMGFRGGRHLGGSPRRRLDDRTEVVAGFGGMGVALTPVVSLEIAEDVAPS